MHNFHLDIIHEGHDKYPKLWLKNDPNNPPPPPFGKCLLFGAFIGVNTVSMLLVSESQSVKNLNI